ncbi:MAG: ABC transporter permease [Solirubrobacterales bacterium]|nr:ABC transporter permease [Solirubrobacterales bacterium]
MTLFGAEFLKLRRRPATYVSLAVLLVILALLYLALASAPTESAGDELVVREILSFPAAYLFLVGFVLGLGGLISVAYGGAASGAEWAWGTLRVALARGESRTRYVLLKFAAVALMLILAVIVVFVVGVLFTLLAASVAGVDPGNVLTRESSGRVPELMAKTSLGLVEHGAIGYFVAQLARSQLVGIGAGIALYFGGAFAAIIPGARDIVPYLPFNVASSMIEAIPGQGDGAFATRTLDPTEAVVWTVGYLALALVLTAIVTERSEIRS